MSPSPNENQDLIASGTLRSKIGRSNSSCKRVKSGGRNEIKRGIDSNSRLTPSKNRDDLLLTYPLKRDGSTMESADNDTK